MSRVPPVGVASPTAARSREVSCLDAHKREETSRSLRRSRIMRDKTGDIKKRKDTHPYLTHNS